MQLSRDETMSLRKICELIIFFKRRKCVSHFEVQRIKRTKQKDKHVLTTMSCPYVILFFEAENVLKEETKNKNCKPIFVTTMSNTKRVFLINISRITAQILSLSLSCYCNYIKIKYNKYYIVGPTTSDEYNCRNLVLLGVYNS